MLVIIRVHVICNEYNPFNKSYQLVIEFRLRRIDTITLINSLFNDLTLKTYFNRIIGEHKI